MKHILIADDNDIEKSLIVYIANKYFPNYKIIILNDGKQVLEYLDKHELPDLITLDLHMPYFNGIEVLKIIKKKKLFVPVVIISASDNKNDIFKCYENGANSYIIKPNDFKLFKKYILLSFRYWTTLNCSFHK